MAEQQGCRRQGQSLSLFFKLDLEPPFDLRFLFETTYLQERQRMERVAAGLEFEFPSRGGRGRGRGRGDRGGRGSDRGRGSRGGSTFGRGRAREDEGEGERQAKRAKTQEDDSSSSALSDGSDHEDGPPIASTSKLPTPSVSEYVPTKSVGLQVHASRLAQSDETFDETPSSTKRIQVVCKHWRKGSCALEKECPYLHEVSRSCRSLSLSLRRVY